MYESLLDPQIQTLNRSLSAWENVMPTIPEDLSPYVPHLTKQSVRRMFVMVIERLERIKLQSEDEVSPFLIQTVAQNFNSWTAQIESWVASGVGNVANIHSHLLTMWSQLNSFDGEPKLPSKAEIQKLVADIDGAKSQAFNLVKNISDELPKFEGKRDSILEQSNQILEKATASFEAAARAGLGKSFEDRAKEYDDPRSWWLFTFIFSLGAIVMIAYCHIFPDLKGKLGLDRLYYFLTDLPLTLPFLWLAWFSALRFSQLGRFKEDYKFKVATALALDGYRKQAGEVNKELEQKLLDLAITNFGENPLRLMTKDSAKDAHPLAGIIDENSWGEILKEGLKSIADKVRK